jgi:hypothetical protein
MSAATTILRLIPGGPRRVCRASRWFADCFKIWTKLVNQSLSKPTARCGLCQKKAPSTTLKVVLLPFREWFAARFCRPSQADRLCDFRYPAPRIDDGGEANVVRESLKGCGTTAKLLAFSHDFPAGRLSSMDPLQALERTVYTGPSNLGVACRIIRFPINCPGCRVS